MWLTLLMKYENIFFNIKYFNDCKDILIKFIKLISTTIIIYSGIKTQLTNKDV